MNITTAFLARDFRVAWSYRFSFLVQAAGLIFSILTLRFVSDLFDESGGVALEEYGGDYFSFALMGIGISVLAYPVTRSFAGGVRAAQVTGTLEAMLTTRASGVGIVTGSGAYPIAAACVQLALAWAVGSFAFGADLRPEGLLLAVFVLAMTVGVLAGIGLMSAAFALAFKQQEPFTGAFLGASFFVSGIVYPQSVLPGWIEAFAPLLPLTHSVELTRRLLLEDAQASDVGTHLVALCAFLALLPAGLVSVSLALRHARRSGSLGQY